MNVYHYCDRLRLTNLLVWIFDSSRGRVTQSEYLLLIHVPIKDLPQSFTVGHRWLNGYQSNASPKSTRMGSVGVSQTLSTTSHGVKPKHVKMQGTQQHLVSCVTVQLHALLAVTVYRSLQFSNLTKLAAATAHWWLIWCQGGNGCYVRCFYPHNSDLQGGQCGSFRGGGGALALENVWFCFALVSLSSQSQQWLWSNDTVIIFDNMFYDQGSCLKL